MAEDYENYFNEDDNSSDSGKKDYPAEIFKKWFKTRDRQGFISIRPFLNPAGKLIVDIGESKGSGVENTSSYINAIELSTVVDLAASGTFSQYYDDKGFVSYGGGRVKGQPVSRVFKLAHWQRNGSVDTSAFQFKNGLFKAKETNSGAFQPDMKSPISVNLIKVSLPEVRVMAKRINLALHKFVVEFDDAFKAFNGELRD